MHTDQIAEHPVAEGPVLSQGRPSLKDSDASVLWAELRDYHRRREAWECDLYRLFQAYRDIEARHWQLVLHAVEAAAGVEDTGARAGLHPPLGEGPSFEERMAFFERSLLVAGLARTGGCRRKAAVLLGLLPTTLCEKLKRLGMAHRTH
jgi:transcriptional regulator with GAF, ATPase, and Fis domain